MHNHDRPMLQTFAILLVFQSVGEVISYALTLPVPGPVLGMILLFGWLVFDDRLLPVIQGTTTELLKHLSLWWCPPGWPSPPPRWSRAC